MTWEDAAYADGPAVVRYLEVCGVIDPVGTDNQVMTRSRYLGRGKRDDHLRDNIRQWRRGACPTFVTLDRLLVAFGMHVSELPDSVWLDCHPRLRRKDEVAA